MQKYREKVRKFSGSLCLIADICDFVTEILKQAVCCLERCILQGISQRMPFCQKQCLGGHTAKDHEWGVGALFSALLPHRLRTREWGASRYSILLSRTAVLACKSHLTEIQERRYSLSSHQNDYTNSVGKRMQGAGKGTKLERAQTKKPPEVWWFFFPSRMCSSEVGRSSGQPTKARCCGFERGIRAYGAFVQKKECFFDQFQARWQLCHSECFSSD